MTIVCAASDTLGALVVPYIHQRIPLGLLITQPDRRVGRGRKKRESTLSNIARTLSIPIYQTNHLKSDAREVVASYKPDVLVSVAFGRKFGPRFMEQFSWGGLNLHPSLLPRHRGCSPLQAAILQGDDTFGVTVQEIAQEMDAGNIVSQAQRTLQGNETYEHLVEESAIIGRELLVKALLAIQNNEYKSMLQSDRGVSYCYRIEKKSGEIAWSLSADYISRMIRAYHPWPGTYTFVSDVRIKIIEASVYDGPDISSMIGAMIKKHDRILVQCGEGVLSIETLQYEGQKKMDAKSFLNGHSRFCEEVFVSSDT